MKKSIKCIWIGHWGDPLLKLYANNNMYVFQVQTERVYMHSISYNRTLVLQNDIYSNSKWCTCFCTAQNVLLTFHYTKIGYLFHPHAYFECTCCTFRKLYAYIFANFNFLFCVCKACERWAVYVFSLHIKVFVEQAPDCFSNMWI